MSGETDRPDLYGEFRFRFRIPLPVAIPLGALAFIGLIAIGFSRVLLSVPNEAAAAIALVTALNVLGACAFVATRERVSGPMLAELAAVVAYPVIIGLAIAQFGVATSEATEEGGGAPVPARLEVTAEGVQFSASSISLEAGKPEHLTFENKDSVEHNLAIYETKAGAADQKNALFDFDPFAGPDAEELEISPLEKGEYVFICDVHPTQMRGEVVVQ